MSYETQRMRAKPGHVDQAKHRELMKIRQRLKRAGQEAVAEVRSLMRQRRGPRKATP